jgi:ACS family glucarate transporter-like MFS transporter
MGDPAVRAPSLALPRASLANTGKATRIRYWVVVFAVTLAVITYIDRVSISVATPLIRQDLHLNTVQMGWVFNAFGVAYALFEIPGGFLGDWIGPRKVLMRVVLWWSVFTAATGWARSLGPLIATRFLFGAGEAGCFPNLTKIFATWLPAKEKVRAQGIVWLAARWGGAFTPPLVTVVMLHVGWRYSFAIFGCVGLVWAVLFYRWFRDNPLNHPSLNQSERDLLQDSAALGAKHADVPWAKLLSSGRVWLLCWQYFCLSYPWYFYITWLPTYLKDNRNMGSSATALLSIMPLFFGGAANYVSVFLAERLIRRVRDLAQTRRILSCLGFLLACVCLTLSTRIQDPFFAVLAIAMASFGGDMAMPHAWGATMDLGGKFSGTLSGAMNTWGNVGGALCPLVIGYVLAWTNNWNLTFYIGSAVYAGGALCWMFLDSVTPLEGETAS